MGLLRKSGTVGTRQVPDSSFDQTELPSEAARPPRVTAILCKLGEGGMGPSTRPNTKIMERVVAVKVIFPRFRGTAPRRPSGSGAKLRAAASWNTPTSSVPTMPTGCGSTMLLAMEFVKGRSLAR